VVFAGWLWREPIGWRRWTGLGLALAGVLLAVTRGRSLAPELRFLPGYLAALGAALTWSLYSVLNRRYAAIPSTAMIGSCAAVALLALATHLLLERSVMPSGTQLLSLGLMGIGPTGAAFLLWDHATKRGDLAVLGLWSNAAPVLSTVLLLALGAQPLHWALLIALLLVTGGVVLGRR
jgi:drug/metabolite transporter (DMT)-like permease